MVVKTSQSITFMVDDVVKAAELLAQSQHSDNLHSLLRCVDALKKQELLYHSHYNAQSVKEVKYHAFLQTVHLAFSQHRPLVLSPDIIWLLILQGFAQHVRNNSESLRHKFVSHEGRIELATELPYDLIMSPEEDWEHLITLFDKKLDEQLTQVYKELAPAFSTSGTIEKLACTVTIMDAFSPYFQYVVYCICGIPSVTLEGSLDDWKLLTKMAERLARYDLDWWISNLIPVLKEFENAAAGQVDLDHWQNIYKLKNAYGGDRVNGWIVKFFPYLKSGYSGAVAQQNLLLTLTDQEEIDNFRGYSTDDFPGGISTAAFTICSLKNSSKKTMQFFSGFFGIEQNEESFALKPMIGWGVAEGSGSNWQLPGDVKMVPPVSGNEYEKCISTMIESRRGLSSIPGDFFTFYRLCDGIVFDAPDAAKFRSLKDVELAIYASTEEDEHEIGIIPGYGLVILDFPDGRAAAIDTTQNYVKNEDGSYSRCGHPVWLVKKGEPLTREDRLADSFKQFVELLIAKGGIW